MAIKLRNEEKCDILVLLSHTGVSRGDTELANQGYFDIIFGGHEHKYDLQKPMKVFNAPPPKIDGFQGEEKRLNLISQGV